MLNIHKYLLKEENRKKKIQFQAYAMKVMQLLE